MKIKPNLVISWLDANSALHWCVTLEVYQTFADEIKTLPEEEQIREGSRSREHTALPCCLHDKIFQIFCI